MNRLQKLWNDIRKGQNIDLLLTIVLTFGLVILNIFGIASSTLIAPLTLAILGLIAISFLESRYQVEELTEKIGQTVDTLFLDEFPPSLDKDIERAKDLWIMGVSLSRTVKTYYSVIERKLKDGHLVKVIVTHPDGVALEQSVIPVYGNKTLETRRSEILGSLQALCELKLLFPENLEIKTSTSYIGHGIIGLDLDKSSGKIYLEYYPFKMPGGSRPKIIITPQEGKWYDYFSQELNVIWKYCANWKCD